MYNEKREEEREKGCARKTQEVDTDEVRQARKSKAAVNLSSTTNCAVLLSATL